MSGVGPVEPGEGTHALESRDGPDAAAPPRPRGRVGEWYARHRRATLATATATALLVGGACLYATRPQPPAPPDPPYPSQVTDVHYLSGEATPAGAGPHSFSFGVELSVLAGPPVTVTRVSQPFAGMSVTSMPKVPFRTSAGTSRKVVITMHVSQCRKVPWNAGLPFLDVTLRNTRAIEVHSFILGQRYAQHLSEALQVACSNGSG
ncbi:Tat pathway signal sequence domain protein [Streptomyces aquilus]|uniref:Tat pathway signal sequence domain protein n=1 Tax=Streptomyces aquilus TaxID=2548456 RepID=UPI0036C5ABE2